MPDVQAEPVDAGGVPGLWLTPPDAVPERVILYFHGGGYVSCSVATHRRLIARLAGEARCRALGIDYRLAPDHAHPAAVDDAVAAYRFLLDEGYAPGGIVLAGDSAGGGLAFGALVAARDAGLPMPAAVLAMSPLVDLEAQGESMRTRADADTMVSADAIARLAAQYLGDQDRRQPTAAPLYADVRGFPPLSIQVGDCEVLLDDATRLADAARAAGVDVTLEVFPEMQHVFQIRVGDLQTADDAVARLGAFARAHFETAMSDRT